MSNELMIAAVDVGKYDNLGLSCNIDNNICKKTFIDDFIKRLNKLKRGVLAIEGPLFIPSDNFSDIACSRKGIKGKDKCDYKIDLVDGMSRPWSMSASFHCAVQFLSIFYSKFTTETQVFTDYQEFIKGGEGILICEAFISGGRPDLKGKEREHYIKKWYDDKKINRHNHDAECAVKLLDNLFSGIIEPEIIMCSKYLNLPSVLLRENFNLKFCGDPKSGIIIKSPKPCFLSDKGKTSEQEIIELFFK